MGAGGVEACPLGGTTASSGSFPFVTVTLSACKVAASVGAVVLDGTLSVQLAAFTAALDIDFEDAFGTLALEARADLAGSLSPSLGGACTLTAATLNIDNGTLSVEASGQRMTSLTFDDTEVVVDNLAFRDPCVPQTYRLTFSGPVAVSSSGGGPFPVDFDAFVVDVDASGDPTAYDLSGDAESACYGGTTTTNTEATLALPLGEICPSEGALAVTLPRGTARIHHRSNGSVDIDNDADGSIDVTVADCLDAQLFSCTP